MEYIWQQLLDSNQANKPHNYDEYSNTSLINLALHAPRRVLDIGCAGGRLGEYIKNKYKASVVGIEVNQDASNKAAKRLDKVLVGNFEDLNLSIDDFDHNGFDTVILSDVLEHMYNPWQALVKLKPLITGDAQLLISIPNTRNLDIVSNLVNEGLWSYKKQGLLDITHIRFFTIKEVYNLLSETGYHIERVEYKIDERLKGFLQERKTQPSFDLNIGRFTLRNVTKKEFTELCTLQFLVVATPVSSKEE